MANSPLAVAAADRNLLFGILALQMDFLSRDALIAAMQAWVFRKDCPLGQILVEQGALQPATRDLLEAVVRENLARHGGDPEQSLAALPAAGQLRADLAKLGDPDLAASSSRLGTPSASGTEAEATSLYQPPVVGPTGNRFRVVRPHAQGGLGMVSVAIDEELGREVALKEMHARHADTPESRARFVREAQVTGGLEHPGVVPVYGLGLDGHDRPYYAMRLIRGENLKDAIDRFHQATGRPPGERVLEFRKLLARFRVVCETVAYAHSRGVLHRDLKPANVMLGSYGETLVVDWGLAKRYGNPDSEATLGPLVVAADTGDTNLTQMGRALGTPAYMSPEQAEGRLDQLGPVSDVYSLGATLYYLLTGEPAFAGSDAVELLAQVRVGAFRPPRQVKSQVAPALQAICLKAMAVRPEDRYRSAQALAEDLERWLADEPVSAYREPWGSRLRRWARRNRGRVTVGTSVLVVALTAAVAVALVASASAEARRQEAVAREMDHLRGVAESERGEADRQRALALQQEELARRYLYLSRMKQAGIAWQEAQLAPFGELLDQERPERTGHADLRGWEWHYLNGLRTRNQLVVPASARSMQSVAFHPDGRRVASAASDGLVKLWDAATGKLLQVIPKSGGDDRFDPGLWYVTFSRDGRHLATGASDVPTRGRGRIQVWETDTGKEVRTFGGLSDPVFSLAFSPDGKRILGPDGGKAKVWDVSTGQEVLTFDKHRYRPGSSAPQSIAISPDGTRVVSRLGDSAHVWDVVTGAVAHSFAEPPPKAVAFSPDGRWIAGALPDGVVRLWDTKTWRELISFPTHPEGVRRLGFSPDGKRLVTASDDRTIRIWDAAKGEEQLTLRGHASIVGQAVFSPDGARLASVAADSTLRVWEPLVNQESIILQENDNWVPGLAFSPDGRHLAHGWRGGVRVWDWATGEVAVTLKGAVPDVHGNRPQLAYSKDGRLLAAPGEKNVVFVWDVSSQTRLFTLAGHVDPATGILFLPDGRLVSVAGNQNQRKRPGEIKIWDLTTGTEQRTLRGHPGGLNTVACTRDGSRLASAGWDLSIRIWDVARGEPLRVLTGHTKSIYGLAFSPDGRTLASCSGDHTIRLWDVETGREVRKLQGHADWVTGLAYSPDGRRLASVSTDRTVKLWDPDTGQEALTLRGHTGRILGVAFSPNGRRLATTAYDRTVRVWDAGPTPSDTEKNLPAVHPQADQPQHQ